MIRGERESRRSFRPPSGFGSWAVSEQLPDCHPEQTRFPVVRYLTGSRYSLPDQVNKIVANIF